MTHKTTFGIFLSSFQLSHFALPTKSVMKGFFVLQSPTVAFFYILKFFKLHNIVLSFKANPMYTCLKNA